MFADLFMQTTYKGYVNSYAYLMACYSNGMYFLNPVVNPISLMKLRNDFNFFDFLSKALLDDKSAFLRQQMLWLGLDYDSGEWLPREGDENCLCCEELTSKLMLFSDLESMEKDSFQELKKELIIVLHRYFPDSFRTDRGIATKKLNHIMISLGVPYQVDTICARKGTRYKVVSVEKKVQCKEGESW